VLLGARDLSVVVVVVVLMLLLFVRMEWQTLVEEEVLE
jgi:hypothetical protein